MRQVRNEVTIAGAACDIDNGMVVDFGQWPTPTAWSASYVNQTFPLAANPFELAPSEEAAGYIEMRNMGNSVWTPGSTFLGTTEPRDGPSSLAHPSWINDHRAATVDHEVAPGDTGRFELTVRAPATLGDYPQYFNLVEEGVAWFSDSGLPRDDLLQVRVTVVEPPSCPADLPSEWGCEGASRLRCGADGRVEREACAGECVEGACDGDAGTERDAGVGVGEGGDGGVADDGGAPDLRSPGSSLKGGCTVAGAGAGAARAHRSAGACLVLLGCAGCALARARRRRRRSA